MPRLSDYSVGAYIQGILHNAACAPVAKIASCSINIPCQRRPMRYLDLDTHKRVPYPKKMYASLKPLVSFEFNPENFKLQAKHDVKSATVICHVFK